MPKVKFLEEQGGRGAGSRKATEQADLFDNIFESNQPTRSRSYEAGEYRRFDFRDVEDELTVISLRSNPSQKMHATPSTTSLGKLTTHTAPQQENPTPIQENTYPPKESVDPVFAYVKVEVTDADLNRLKKMEPEQKQKGSGGPTRTSSGPQKRSSGLKCLYCIVWTVTVVALILALFALLYAAILSLLTDYYTTIAKADQKFLLQLDLSEKRSGGSRSELVQTLVKSKPKGELGLGRYGSSIKILNDYNVGLTAIVDETGDRCFLMPLSPRNKRIDSEQAPKRTENPEVKDVDERDKEASEPEMREEEEQKDDAPVKEKPKKQERGPHDAARNPPKHPDAEKTTTKLPSAKTDAPKTAAEKKVHDTKENHAELDVDKIPSMPTLKATLERVPPPVQKSEKVVGDTGKTSLSDPPKLEANAGVAPLEKESTENKDTRSKVESDEKEGVADGDETQAEKEMGTRMKRSLKNPPPKQSRTTPEKADTGKEEKYLASPTTLPSKLLRNLRSDSIVEACADKETRFVFKDRNREKPEHLIEMMTDLVKTEIFTCQVFDGQRLIRVRIATPKREE